MKNFSKCLLSIAGVSSIAFSGLANATNGMNLEGYGPEAAAMGGASMAYDNGTAAMVNNPATLGLAKDGKRADYAVGLLGPNITSSAGGASVDSTATAFIMPALGWVSKSNGLAYGFGVFAQGGMGTDYKAGSLMSAGSGLATRSELGVGRAMIPFSYNVTNQLVVGGSVDFVWAGLDLKMAMSGAQMQDMMQGGTQAAGTLSGTLVDTLGGMMGAGAITALNWGYFDFSNDSDFYGEALGTGFGAKLGAVFKVNSKLAFGATYHSKTFIGDMETDNATVTMNVDGDEGALTTGTGNGNPVTMSLPVKGKISVNDFQWPSMYGLGVAFEAMDGLMLAADIKRINWSGVMESFNMTFTAGADQGGFANLVMDADLLQKWKDQTVFAVGASYQVNKAFVIRAGLNRAENPIPNSYLNALFPAIQQNHATFGGGYMINDSSVVNVSMTYAPESSFLSASGVTTAMSQMNYQVMYSMTY